MITIRQAALPQDCAAIEALFGEFLHWVCPRIYDEYRVVFDADRILVRDMDHLDSFMPPAGLLLLAFDGDSPVGCACARQNDPKIAELKRTYVRPAYRGKGIGRLLVMEVIAAVRGAGYERLRLDSAGFMHEAHALYRSLGFLERTPYEGSEIPPEHSEHWLYMELAMP